MIREKTGLPISAYFSATKIRWILDHVAGAQERAEAGELVFGTVDTWLLWQLTDGETHATDASNASRTMLYNIHTQAWDEELLQLFNIPASMLPTVHTSSEVIAQTNPMQFFGGRVPVASVIGDQNASLVGQLALSTRHWQGWTMHHRIYGKRKTVAFIIKNIHIALERFLLLHHSRLKN